MTADCNPFLKPWSRRATHAEAQKGSIERPDRIVNIPWQTRAAPPSEYESQLGDALEAAFASGAEQLDEVVAKLNDLGLRTPAGTAWTAAGFESEMRRLAGPATEPA